MCFYPIMPMKCLILLKQENRENPNFNQIQIETTEPTQPPQFGKIGTNQRVLWQNTRFDRI